MSNISKALRQEVAEKAHNCCEYCQTSQHLSGAQMHIDHIIPLAKKGTSTLDNLCLSCAWCNSFKGAKIEAIDPISQQTKRLFHPREDHWSEHFIWHDEGIMIAGLTAIGRATVDTLNMNNQFIVPARKLWVVSGWHPPQ